MASTTLSTLSIEGLDQRQGDAIEPAKIRRPAGIVGCQAEGPLGRLGGDGGAVRRALAQVGPQSQGRQPAAVAVGVFYDLMQPRRRARAELNVIPGLENPGDAGALPLGSERSADLGSAIDQRRARGHAERRGGIRIADQHGPPAPFHGQQERRPWRGHGARHRRQGDLDAPKLSIEALDLLLAAMG